jgi:acetoin utilization protein AcuB
MQNVADLMTRDPVTVQPDVAALAALDLMIDRGIRHLPVLDRHSRVCGVLSLDDLRAALPFSVSLRRPPTPSERQSGLDCAVGEVMTHAPITASPSTTLAEAASLLVRFRIGCLPVVDESGKLAGIFSETDALQALVTGLRAQPEKPARVLDLELLVAELRSERSRIGAQLTAIQRAERELTLSGEGASDRKERAAHLAQLEVEEPLAALAARRLEGIDHALVRASRGRLGLCDCCEREIPIARLRALPGTSLCIRCAAEAASDARAKGAGR